MKRKNIPVNLNFFPIIKINQNLIKKLKMVKWNCLQIFLLKD